MTAPTSHAVATAHGRNSRRRNTDEPDPKLVLLLACGAVFVSILDLTVVNVAFPDLRADFPSASLPTLSWVITAYGVMFAALLSTAGRLADVIGRQRLFMWSVAAFTATSMLAAAAPNESVLIFFRGLQGASAAGMSPAALGLILVWTPRERLMAAIGVWGATGAVAAAVGPALGGVLVNAWGWRAIFLINVPIGVATVYGAMTRLSRDSPGGRRLPDPIGTVLFVAGIGAVVVSLSQGSQWGWTSGPVVLALAGGVLAVGAGLVRSARHPVPAIELDLWRNRTFTVANGATVLFSASAFAMVLNGPIFLTATWNYSVLETGLALTPGAFASAVGSVLAGRRATTPSAKRTAAVGGSLLLATAGFFLWSRLGTQERFVDVYLPGSLMTGLGFGLALTALFGAGATSIPPSRFASGSGILTMSRQLGGALGVAATAAILPASGFSGGVDPFLAVYLFCGVLALTGAAASVGLPRPSPAGMATRVAGDDAAETAAIARTVVDGGKRAGAGNRGTGGLAPAAGRGGMTAWDARTDSMRRRRRGVVALAGLVTLAGLGVFSISAGADVDSGGAATATATAAASSTAQSSTPSTSTASTASTASRSLALIDVSASMGEGAGADVSRLQATTQAVAAGVGPVPETTEVGVWLFGSRLRGELDWVGLLPVGPLGERLGPATRREVIQSGLGQVGALPDDSLGLYDSVLAAFRTMNSSYRPDVSNTVVVFTDGRDNDPTGVTLEGLQATLAREFDPAHPVQINIIGYGDGMDRGALAQIAETTRGGVYAASSPQQARELFLTAMSPRG